MGRIDAPIWKLEEKLFDIFELVTGKDRMALRSFLLYTGVIIDLVAHRTVMLPFLFLIPLWAARLLKWGPPLGPRDDGYMDNYTRSGAAVVLYAHTLLFLSTLVNVPSLTTIGLFYGAGVLFLSDFVLWANHMNKPRKKRKTMPEHLREKFAQFEPVPQGG